MGLPNTKRSLTYTLSFLLLTAMSWTTPGQQQWTRTAFEKLFPSAATGWSVSEMQVRELETLGSRFEKMGNLAAAIAGKPTLAESVCYELKREYRSGARLIHVVINSEDVVVLTIVLPAHGYAFGIDGKREPLPAANQKARDELLRKGLQPFKLNDHLAARATEGSKSFLAVLVGDDGGISFECDYANCLGDVDALMKTVDLNNLDSFARFYHAKTKQGAEPVSKPEDNQRH